MKPSSGLLRREQVRLTAPADADIPIIAHWKEDVHFFRLCDDRSAQPRSGLEVAEWLKRGRQDGYPITSGIALVVSDERIATAHRRDTLWAGRVCGMGLAIGNRQRWSQGLQCDAGRLALTSAFDALGLDRLTATVFSYEARSVALVEKFAFQREGIFRDFLGPDGERHDMLICGLVRPDWKSMDNGTPAGDSR